MRRSGTEEAEPICIYQDRWFRRGHSSESLGSVVWRAVEERTFAAFLWGANGSRFAVENCAKGVSGPIKGTGPPPRLCRADSVLQGGDQAGEVAVAGFAPSVLAQNQFGEFEEFVKVVDAPLFRASLNKAHAEVSNEGMER